MGQVQASDGQRGWKDSVGQPVQSLGCLKYQAGHWAFSDGQGDR